MNWEYLDFILLQMNYGHKWQTWIKGCFWASRPSVIVNGSQTDEFEIQKECVKVIRSFFVYISCGRIKCCDENNV